MAWRLLACLCIALVASDAVAAAAAAAAAAPAPAYDRFQECALPAAVDTAAIDRFSQFLRFNTVSSFSTTNHALNPGEHDRLAAWLPHAYPAVWSALGVERVGVDQLSYLLTWQGSEPQLRPVLFISHVDTVAVASETLEAWTQPPFSGAVADGFIWGRGAMDAKVGVIGLLEAATALLASGYRPRRTLLLAFGHDEEVGGRHGAGHIAALLESRHVELEMVWDEGMGVSMDGVPPFARQPVAMVATAEKAYHSLEITVHSPGGHSSMPPVDGSSIAARLARVLAAISSRPPPPKLVSPTREFLTAMAPLAPWWLAPSLRAVGWFPPAAWLMAQLMARAGSEPASMVRTTAAVTRISAGTGDNILPQSARVLVNFRLLPGDTVDSVMAHARTWLGGSNASLVGVQSNRTVPAHSTSLVADCNGPHFAILRAAIQSTWKLQGARRPLPLIPLLLPAMTDSRHYTRLSPRGVLRWSPFTLRRAQADVARIHGVNERVSIIDFMCGIATYHRGLAGFGDFTGEGDDTATGDADDDADDAGGRNVRMLAATAGAQDEL